RPNGKARSSRYPIGGGRGSPRLCRPLCMSRRKKKETVMRTLRTLLLGLAGVLLALPAIAADLGGAPPRRRLKDEPPASSLPLYSWSGLYIGVHVGYGWSDLDWTALGTTVSDNGGGWLGGGQIGYNWQRGSLVFGVEADISSSGM